jgi:phosphatidylinositol dimannoside acyltransferase
VLVEPLSPALAREMKRLRDACGLPGLDVGYGGMAQGLRHLRAGKILCIVADRDIQGNGVVVPFFGVPVRMPPGPVELAARTGAVMLPIFSRRHGKTFEVCIEEPVDLVNTGHKRNDSIVNTKRVLERIESWIKPDPGQWMVLDRIWKPVPKEALPLPPLAPEPAKTAAQSS